jgi:carboxyl-terminal processing protease
MEQRDTQVPKPKVFLPLLLALCTAVGIIVGLNIPRYQKEIALYQNRPDGGKNHLISEILGFIDAKYVDEPNSLGIDEEVIQQLLQKLDPHTVYLNPQELLAAQEEMDGAFKGIGIEFLMVNDTLQVITPIAQGPADQAGIWSGDQFISVNDTLIAGVKVSDDRLFKLLRGEKGTTVNVSVRRGQESVLRNFTLTRDEIPVHSVGASYLLDEQTAYLKLARFNHNTHQEFLDALLPLAKDKAQINLVLDLRGNPGGLLDQAIQVLSNIFSEGKLLVYTEGRADKKREYKSSGRIQVNIDQVVVLIDEGSASASEVVAGAIQDHDRGWIIGTRSFGKGLVQEQYDLSNGGAIRITVSRYYTPSGRCIQKDFSDKALYKNEHLLRGAQDSIVRAQNVDSTAYYTGMGRKVFSNSGITPDIEVAESEVRRSALFGRARVHVSHFTAKWVEGKRKEDFDQDLIKFDKALHIDSKMLDSFKAFALQQGLKLTETDWKTIETEIATEIKASITRSFFGQNGFQYVKNQNDLLLRTALDKIKNHILVSK